MKKSISHHTYKYNPVKSKEKLDKEHLTVPNQVHSLKEMLNRHMSGQEIYGIQVDWNTDGDENIIPVDQQQNLDLTDVDNAQRNINEIKQKIKKAEEQKKLKQKEKQESHKSDLPDSEIEEIKKE